MKRIFLIALISFLLIDYSYCQSLAYDNVGSFGSHGIGWALVQKDQKVGFINTKGEEIVPIKYDNIGNFGSHGIG
ncbi:WG containing repeat-containing protein, partial [Algoriphagus locisalis]